MSVGSWEGQRAIGDVGCNANLGKGATLDQQGLACKTLVNRDYARFSREMSSRQENWDMCSKDGWVQYRRPLTSGQSNLISTMVQEMTRAQAAWQQQVPCFHHMRLEAEEPTLDQSTIYLFRPTAGFTCPEAIDHFSQPLNKDQQTLQGKGTSQHRTRPQPQPPR